MQIYVDRYRQIDVDRCKIDVGRRRNMYTDLNNRR